MSRQSDIIALFSTHISSLAPVYRGYKFLPQVNEFPFITYVVGNNIITHISDDVRYSSLEIVMRCYVRGEDSLGLADQLALDIEDLIIDFRDTTTLVEECKILNVKTDEGLMDPYGFVDMDLLLVYEHASEI
jgi:hypothetical protein